MISMLKGLDINFSHFCHFLMLTLNVHALIMALTSFSLSILQTFEFWSEAEILSKLHHPNVVAFYGVVQDGPGGTLATVTEFMVDGSLRHVLLRKDRYNSYL